MGWDTLSRWARLCPMAHPRPWEKHITTEYAPPLVGTAFALLFGLAYVSLMFHRHIPVDLKANPRLGYLWFGLSGITSASGVALLYFALSKAPVVVISPVVRHKSAGIPDSGPPLPATAGEDHKEDHYGYSPGCAGRGHNHAQQEHLLSVTPCPP